MASELEKMLRQINGQAEEGEPGGIANFLFFAFVAVMLFLFLAFTLLSAL